MIRGLSLLCVSAACLAAAGCGGTINIEKELEVKGGDIKAAIFTARKDQELTVTVTASDFVNAYLVLEKDRPALERQVENNVARPPQALDSQVKLMEGELKAKVPGGNEVAVVIVSRGQQKPAKVTLKGTGR